MAARTWATRLVVIGLVLAMPAVAGAGTYVTGSEVNLCTIRGADASTSNGAVRADEPLHPAYGCEVRYTQGGEPATWWQVELPEAYKVERYDFAYYPGLYSQMSVKVQTSLDGSTWTDRTGVLTDTNGVSGVFAGGAVDAKFVRLVTLSYTGWSEMILQKARLRGPNDPEISPAISVAQSTWNDGSAVRIDPWLGGGTPQAVPGVVDDYDVILTNYWTNGVGQQETNEANLGQTVDPYYDVPAGMASEFIVSLNDAYLVDAVGLSTIADNRAARDLNVYLSPDAAGDTWTLVKEIRDLPNGSLYAYSEHAIDSDIQALRVRFEIFRNWSESTNLNGNLLMSEGYIAELFVYPRVVVGEPIPEPATMALLGLGGLALLRRRRRAG